MATSTIELDKIAELTAACLPGWRFNRVFSDSRTAVFSNEGRDTFNMRKSWRDKGRLIISADKTRHSITVSEERAPQAIANDIQRRFLPKYLDDLNEHKERERQRARTAEDYTHKIALLEAILGTLKSDWHNRGEMHFNNGTVNFNYDDSVTVGFRVSFDDAIRLSCKYKELQDVKTSS